MQRMSDLGAMTSSATLVTGAGDTPRRAYSLLERRATVILVGCLLGAAGIAWLLTVQQAPGMANMGSLALVGAPMSMSMSAPLFMATWLTMMVAMMFPAVAPMVLAHRMVTRHRRETVFSSGAFLAGYLSVWTIAGLVPLAAFLVFRAYAVGALGETVVAVGAGAVVAIAGAYQFTQWKSTCLRACRTPLGFIMTHDFRRGSRGAVLAGLSHGAYCLGCCWALMTVLLVVGVMNLTWMAALAVVFLAEKNWSHGVALTHVVGVLLLVLGATIALDPALLHFISGVPVVHPSMGGQMQ
jgi:predicted metal-binding membrane protein